MDWEGETARAVITERVYPTHIRDLWDAIVNPQRLQRWFLPITGDLREGGHYQLEGNAGGTITRCDAPSFLAITWEMHGGIGWVNIKLDDVEGESTHLTLEHIAHDEAAFLAFWDEFGPGSLGVGWELGLLGLAEHLASGGDSAPRDEAAWVKTEVGRRFIRASSDGWAAAEIEFGTDAEQASVAGERTFAFYTGASAE